MLLPWRKGDRTLRAVLREAGRQGLVNTVMHWSLHNESKQHEQKAVASSSAPISYFLFISKLTQCHRVSILKNSMHSVVSDVKRTGCSFCSNMDMEQFAALPISVSVTPILTASSCSAVWGFPACQLLARLLSVRGHTIR